MNDRVEQEIQKMERQDDIAKAEGFSVWKNRPEVRVLLSMIPEGEKPGLVEMILQSAFESGYACGSVNVMTQLLKRMR